ncbi:hypothetical protein [Clostridium sp. M14]|uniref:hypothetical protein n=1 Tax=Clostridium sp. M14 TaxID=2716311 RepID=UPI0013EE958D|nr:hypothetical protein [Clostridium sp. M14]MBZ9693409.1 hypothetical protein [Clostridium sp. M14]
MECINCKEDKKKSNFYEGFNECKDCIKFKIDNVENYNIEQCIINILYDNGYKFNKECFNYCFDKTSKTLEGLSNNERFTEYLKRINSLPQYEDYRYGNKNNYSQVTITPDGVTCTFGEFKVIPNSLLESLINEENELLRKIKYSRDNKDFGTYKNLIRALTDITTLKNRELDRLPKDKWKSMYRHYKEKNEKGDFEDMVATWEQKGDDIRNHKIYKIEKEIDDNATRTANALKSINKKLSQQYNIVKYLENILNQEISNKSVYDVFKEISKIWDKIEDKDKFCKIIAGEEYYSIIYTILDNVK